DALQLAADPAIRGREAHVAVERSAGRAFGLAVLDQAAVLALGVHQHEARRVPELVAEVAIALAALGVEVDVAAQARVAGHREAQRIRAVGRNAAGELLAHARG